MRFQKIKKENIKGMERHNERESDNHSNDNIDTTKKHLNYNLVECDNYKQKIEEEIEKRYTGKKAIRKDAVYCTEFIFTSDSNFFENLSDEQEKIYFEKSIEFLEKTFSKENIISATVHMDEKTPHLHAVIVPLTEDGKLSFKSFVNGKKDMQNLQDNYYNHISEHFSELERGKSVTETKNKHIKIQDYKKKTKYLDNEIDQLENTISNNSNNIKDLKELKIIEDSTRNNFFTKTISIEIDNFEKVVSLAKKRLTDNKKIELLEKKIEEYKEDNNYLYDRNNTLQFEKGILSVKNEGYLKQNIYIQMLEEKLLDLDKNALKQCQKDFIKTLPVSQINNFIKERKNNNTYVLFNNNKQQKDRGFER